MGASIVEALGAGLVGIVTQSASAMSAGIQGLLFNEEGNALSTTGTALFAIVGIGFGVGIFYVIIRLLRLR